jgi:hypothetical protein
MRNLSAGWVVLVLLLAVCAGCRPPAEPETPKDLKGWFQQKERHFSSEDGIIDMQSVREVGSDTLEYQTVKNGARKTWRTKYRPTGSGYERVGDPQDITAKVKAE